MKLRSSRSAVAVMVADVTLGLSVIAVFFCLCVCPGCITDLGDGNILSVQKKKLEETNKCALHGKQLTPAVGSRRWKVTNASSFYKCWFDAGCCW